jgi:alkylated DNA repair protein alkB family protein 8
VVKPGGKILIQVWALEQKFSKVTYSEKDVMIPWRAKKHNFETPDAERYYHLFEQFELEKLCSSIESIIIKESYCEHDNYGIILEKV